MANWYTGSTKYTAVAAWAALTIYSVGQIVRQLAAPTVGNERCFRVSAITTGVSGAAEPTWNLGKGVTTTDSGVTWTECTGVANQNGDGGGAAWAAPHARLANAFAWGAAGDIFYVSNNHAESQATTITLSAPQTQNTTSSIYCVTDTVVPPTTLNNTATITGAAASIGIGSGSGYFYGISFIVTGSGNNNISLNQSGGGGGTLWDNIFENCIFNNGSSNATPQIGVGGYGFFTNLLNCTFRFGNTAQGILTGGNGNAQTCRFNGCTFADTGSVPTTLFGASYLGTSIIEVRDSDMSTITGSLVALGTDTNSLFTFSNCKINASVSPGGGSSASPGNTQVRMDNCDSGATNYRFACVNYMGTIKQETTVVRTGGATDGTTPLSWNITTSANTSFQVPFETGYPYGEEIAVWNDQTGSAITATAYLITNTTLNNNDFWMEVEYLGASGNPKGSTVTTKKALLATAAALTSDSSTWGGAITNKYKVVATFTPQMKGPIKIRLYVAKPSVTVYVDPYISISGQTSGRQYLIPGWGYQNDAAAGGAGVAGPIICSGGI